MEKKVVIELEHNPQNVMAGIMLAIENINRDYLGTWTLIVNAQDMYEVKKIFERNRIGYRIFSDKDHKFIFDGKEWDLKVFCEPNYLLAIALEREGEKTRFITSDFGKYHIYVKKVKDGFTMSHTYHVMPYMAFINLPQNPGIQVNLLLSKLAAPMMFEGDIISNIEKGEKYPLYVFDPCRLFYYDIEGSYDYFFDNKDYLENSTLKALDIFQGAT